MRLPEPPSFRLTTAFLLPACLMTAALASASPGSSDQGGAGHAPSAPASCWAITGPFTDGKETYFEASSQCESAFHCHVWVNAHEPPYMLHLSPGTSGRIDVGVAQPGDTYSQSCEQVGLQGEQN